MAQSSSSESEVVDCDLEVFEEPDSSEVELAEEDSEDEF